MLAQVKPYWRKLPRRVRWATGIAVGALVSFATQSYLKVLFPDDSFVIWVSHALSYVPVWALAIFAAGLVAPNLWDLSLEAAPRWLSAIRTRWTKRKEPKVVVVHGPEVIIDFSLGTHFSLEMRQTCTLRGWKNPRVGRFILYVKQAGERPHAISYGKAFELSNLQSPVFEVGVFYVYNLDVVRDGSSYRCFLSAAYVGGAEPFAGVTHSKP